MLIITDQKLSHYLQDKTPGRTRSILEILQPNTNSFTLFGLKLRRLSGIETMCNFTAGS